MLPFGADLANLSQTIDMARRRLWDCMQHVNNLDKVSADQAFKDFKTVLSQINKETDQLLRNSKLFHVEFQQQAVKVKKDGLP